MTIFDELMNTPVRGPDGRPDFIWSQKALYHAALEFERFGNINQQVLNRAMEVDYEEIKRYFKNQS